MKKLSNKSLSVEPSLTRKLFNLAHSYNDVIDFTLGDPDVPTPMGIKKAGCSAIMENKTRYSQNAGLLELRKSISKYNQVRENIIYNPETEILVSVGAMEGLFLALLSILDDFDEVIIPAPYYINYKQMVRICGGIPIVVEDSMNQLECSIETIKTAISEKTKAIIINTPCNPTGKVFDNNFIAEISDIAKKYDLYVITDEVYKCLIYDQAERPCSIASYEGMKERTIYINSLSKEFCMTGWRIGYVLANAEVISTMTILQENIVACAPLPSQYAAIEALRTDYNYSAEMVDIFERRRNILIEEFRNAKNIRCIKPQATFYAMVDISNTGMKSEQFSYALLEREHVAVVPGITYGNCCDNYIRMAFTIDENLIRKGVYRICRFVDYLCT